MSQASSPSPLTFGETNIPGFGWLTVAANSSGLCHLGMQVDPSDFRARHSTAGDPDPAAAETVSAALGQLEAYFAGSLRAFDLPIDWASMPLFQQRVLRLTAAIPFGSLRTYGDLARELAERGGAGGGIGAARAVGRALATNPIGIVLPCHRVIGADGGLHGFSAAGGLTTKAWLLRLEGHQLLGERLLLPGAQPALPGLF